MTVEVCESAKPSFWHQLHRHSRRQSAMAKMAASMVESGEDAFRKIFKCYRRKHPPPDFSDVIDFSTGEQSDKVSKTINWPAPTLGDATYQLLKVSLKV